MPEAGLDHGLLHPVWAGSPAARGDDDGAFVQALLDVERTWLTVCIDAGLAPKVTSGVGGDAWEAGSYDLASVAARSPGGGNPFIPLLADVRAALRDEGDDAAAAAVHLGATSQDIIDSALMLLAARGLDEALPTLRRACDDLADLARAHRDTLTVARSLGQHALPTTFGARVATWLEGLSVATAELTRQRGELPVQWGGAVGTSASLVAHLAARDTEDAAENSDTDHSGGADLDEVRADRPDSTVAEAQPSGDRSVSTPRQAHEWARSQALRLRAHLADALGLRDHPGWDTARQPVLALGVACAAVVAATGKIGTDVVTASRAEIGEVAEPSVPGRGGSSAMPHKRNPVLSVMLRSAAMSAPGHLSTLALAGGVAGDERPDGAWHAEWPALRELLRLVGGVAPVVAELAAGLNVEPEALRGNLGRSVPAVLTERIMLTLAPRVERDHPGEGRDRVQSVLDAALAADDPDTALRDGLAGLASPVELDDLLDPGGYTGLAPDLVIEAIRRHRERTDIHPRSPRPPRLESDEET